MRDLTKKMIKEFKIMQLGYDFLGYKVNRKQELSYHHLIIPRRYCKEKDFGEGNFFWNGAILRQDTSHNYLHLIEAKDLDVFMAITSEMIDQNIKGYLDINNLRRIRDMLEYFENKHLFEKSKKGKLLIKAKYINERVKI